MCAPLRTCALAALSLVAAFLAPAAAKAAATCAFAAGTATVTLASNDAGVVSVSGTAVRLNGANCGTATVFNTDLIRVVGNAGAEQATLDLSGGPFAPGATTEPGEALDIEFDIDLAGGSSDRLILAGSGGADTLTLGASGINLNGDDDADVTALANVEAFTVTSAGGDDLLSAAGGDGTGAAFVPAVSLSGDAGNDTFTSRVADDVLAGGVGTDTVEYSAAPSGVTVDLSQSGPQSTVAAGLDTLTGIENVTGSAGDDTLMGDAAANTLAGAAGADTLSGGLANDSLTGGDGNDLLAGLVGNDALDGGDGVDGIDYAAATAAVTVNLSTLTTAGGAGADTLVGIENVTGSAFGDVFVANAASNVLAGGAGIDSADYSTSPAAVEVSLTLDTASGGSGSDSLTDIENVTGSAFNDLLTGDDGANVISGGAGVDLIAGGLGDDTLDGGGGFDTADYTGAPTPVTVNLTSLAASGGAGLDSVAAFEGAIGSAYTDLLIGDTAANVLAGAAGDDTLRGLAGNDTLDGGAGKDTVDYSSHAPASLRVGVSVNLARGSAAGEGFDLLTGLEDVVGSAYEDVLVGDSAKNGLTGGRGDDALLGGGGDDVLWGGAGRDRLEGESGRDLLHSRDGARDKVSGGKGLDRARFDRRLDQVRGVERALVRPRAPSKADAPGKAVGFPLVVGGGRGDRLHGGLVSFSRGVA